MFTNISNFFASRWTLVQRFRFVSFIVMLLGTIVIGRWLADQIRTSVIHQAGVETALYLDSFVVPNLQDLSQSKSLTKEHFDTLNKLLTETNIGRHVVTVKVWDKDGHILYSNRPSLIGLSFPAGDDISTAWQGQIVTAISDLQDSENFEERLLYTRLLEIYTPVRLNGTHQVIAVVEFYREVDVLDAQIVAAQRQGWFVVGISMTMLYLVLIGFFQLANNRIKRQETALKNQVAQWTEVLSYNEELNHRIRRATANTAALNESLMRRTSAELHKGPIQEMSLALLRLDRAMSENEVCRLIALKNKCNENLPIVQTSIESALQEMRAIATGLGLPELGNLTLPEVIARVVRSHEKNTGSKVTLDMSDIPDQATLPIKITAYRFIQEALNNACRHAGGVDQQVQVIYAMDQMQIDVSDRGPGFDINRALNLMGHLGLTGMRERVESMGGVFKIESKINEGTKVTATLFLQKAGEILNV